MQRWITLLLGAAVVVLAAVLVFKGFSPPKPVPYAGAADGGDAGLVDAAADGAPGLGELPGEGGLSLSDFGSPSIDMRFIDAGAFGKMPDGTPVPPLPATTPKTVRVGVVLISYFGAQPGPLGDKPNPRTKAAAKELADKLAAEAQTDFRGAVQRGDPGSQDDIGRMKVGFLEPAADYIVFTLPVGAVSPAFDTPRGFWIVKRHE